MIKLNESTLQEEIDGCVNQYRCSFAVYFMVIFSLMTLETIIYRTIGAPGHGKDIVDCINAIDKRYKR